MATLETIKIPSTRKNAKGAHLDLLLYLPTSPPTTPLPAIILCSGIGAINTRTSHLVPFATTFASAGYAALTFDYLTFGASSGEPRHVLVVEDQRSDAADVLAWARSQPSRFDPSRLVLWGSSFGGMHVTALAATDHQLAAAVAQCPLVDGLKASLQIPPLRAIKLGLRGVADVVRGVVLKGKPVYVPLYGVGGREGRRRGERGAALMEGQHVVDGWRLVAGPEGFEEYPNYIAARIALALGLHRPVKAAGRIRCPLLVVLPEWDGEASLSAAEEVARRAPKGESVRVKGGHFDLYEGGPGYERNVEAQLEFLRRVFAEVEAEGGVSAGKAAKVDGGAAAAAELPAPAGPIATVQAASTDKAGPVPAPGTAAPAA